jgi:hypothetical protein
MNNYFLTQNSISFISTLDKSLIVDKSNKYNYLKLNGLEIFDFVQLLSKIHKFEDIFLIFPFISTSEKMGDPYLRLSEPFFITKQSNPRVISEFLTYQ